MNIHGKPFILLVLIIFCLVGLETQTALLCNIKPSDASSSPFSYQGHTCECNDEAGCRTHCCCPPTPSLPLKGGGKGGGVPVQTGISYFAKTLHCRGVHTDIPIGHLTQYEPPDKIVAKYILTNNGTLLMQKDKKPLEPCLSPPYKPPEIPS